MTSGVGSLLGADGVMTMALGSLASRGRFWLTGAIAEPTASGGRSWAYGLLTEPLASGGLFWLPRAIAEPLASGGRFLAIGMLTEPLASGGRLWLSRAIAEPLASGGRFWFARAIAEPLEALLLVDVDESHQALRALPPLRLRLASPPRSRSTVGETFEVEDDWVS